MPLRTLLNILLFNGRKAILLNWKKLGVPDVAYWKGLVNSKIPHYRATYEARVVVRNLIVWHA